jgi:hypothetical protein
VISIGLQYVHRFVCVCVCACVGYIGAWEFGQGSHRFQVLNCCN